MDESHNLQKNINNSSTFIRIMPRNCQTTPLHVKGYLHFMCCSRRCGYSFKISWQLKGRRDFVTKVIYIYIYVYAFAILYSTQSRSTKEFDIQNKKLQRITGFSCSFAIVKNNMQLKKIK